MPTKYYGMFGKAPKERTRLHTWALTKKKADEMAKKFKGGLALEMGWKNVSVKQLSPQQLSRLRKKAKDFDPSKLPRTMQNVLKKKRRR